MSSAWRTFSCLLDLWRFRMASDEPKKAPNLGQQASSYAGACSIHGLTYIAEERPIVERLQKNTFLAVLYYNA